MMSKYQMCCPECLEDIARNSTAAGKLWMELCAYQMRAGEYFRIVMLEYDSLQKLEQLGYVLTTEECRLNDVQHEILIKINGFTYLKNGSEYFCRGKHG